MSEGPYRNMSFEDAANAMTRIYKLLYPRKFHSYNVSLDEPFADYVGTRLERDPIPEDITKFNGNIGKVIEQYTPILGDISYSTDDTAEEIPAGKSKVILDLHGMAILNSLLEVAELGAKYINAVMRQISDIKNGSSGITITAIGNAFAEKYLDLFNTIDSKFTTKNGPETLDRVKTMITRLSSSTRSGVVAKNVNVVTSIKDYQVGQEEVISDAFDKDFLEYFMMYLEAENELHAKVKADYDTSVTTQRDTTIESYTKKKGMITKSNDTQKYKKFPKYVDVSGCRASCVGLCVASCANTCFGCTDRCSGQCTAKCADCTNSCMTNCITSCQGTCNNECIGCSKECTGGCIGNCTNSCGGDCTNGCGSCEGSCFGTAEGFVKECMECGVSCKGTCGDSCESTTSSIDPGPNPLPEIEEIVAPDSEDPPIYTPPVNQPSTTPPGPTSKPNYYSPNTLVAPNQKSLELLGKEHGQQFADNLMSGYDVYVKYGWDVHNYTGSATPDPSKISEKK